MEVALVGHPNVGKSVLFNRMTGVGAISSNYPGTTVEYLEGTVVHKGVTLHVYDLPGTYGLTGATEDEVVAVKLLAEHRPDVVVAVADATRLEPSLVMIYQLIELGFNVIVALNFMDVARRRHQIDVKRLQDIIKVPVVPMVALTEEGVDVLVESIIQNKARVSDFSIRYAEGIENVLQLLTPAASMVESVYPARGALLKLLEGNQYFTDHLPESVKKMAVEVRAAFNLKHGEDIDVHINRDRYGEAGLTIGKVQSRVERHLTRAERISEITLKPNTGIPILFAVLIGVFFTVVIVGGALEGVLSTVYLELTSGFFEGLASAIGGTFGLSISKGIDLSIQAIISIVIPYILVFYLILALLEDSGYLPRVVILLDGVMHKFGLHGRAIIPMIVGTGCNVPAILGHQGDGVEEGTPDPGHDHDLGGALFGADGGHPRHRRQVRRHLVCGVDLPDPVGDPAGPGSLAEPLHEVRAVRTDVRDTGHGDAPAQERSVQDLDERQGLLRRGVPDTVGRKPGAGVPHELRCARTHWSIHCPPSP